MRFKLYIGKQNNIKADNAFQLTFTTMPHENDQLTFQWRPGYPNNMTLSTYTIQFGTDAGEVLIPINGSTVQLAQDFRSIVSLDSRFTLTTINSEVVMTANNGSPITNITINSLIDFVTIDSVYRDNIDYYPLSMYGDETIEYTNKLSDIEGLDGVFTDSTNTFTVPADDNNNELLNHYYDNRILSRLNANVIIPGYIEIESLPIKYVSIQLEKATLKQFRPSSYKLTVYGNLIQLDEVFGDDTIDKLDYQNTSTGGFIKRWDSLSQFDYDFTQSNFIKTLKDPSFLNGDVMTPLIYFGDKDVALGGGNFDNIQDITTDAGALKHSQLRPAIRVMKILEAIETKYNISFTRNFFGSAVFSNLFLWMNNLKDDILANKYDMQIINPFVGPNNGSAVYNGNFISLTHRLYSGFGAVTYRAYIDYHIVPSSPGVQYDVFLVDEFDTVQYQYLAQSGTFDINLQWDSSFDFDDNPETRTETLKLQIRPYSSISFTVDYHVAYIRQAASIFTTWVDQNSTSNSNTLTVLVSMENNIPQMKVNDLIKGIMKMFKLVIRPIDGQTFYVDTIDGFYNNGTILNVSEYVDNKQMDHDRPLLYKNIILKYQKTNNVLGKKFRQTYDPVNDEIGYGDLRSQQIYINDKTELKVDVPFENMLFERLSYYPTLISTPVLTNINIGMSVQTSDYKTFSPNNSKPILFFNNGIVNNDPHFYKIDYIGSLTTLDTSYLIGNTDNHLLDQVRNTINFGAEVDPYHLQVVSNSLYQNYWSNWINTIYDIKQDRTTIDKVWLPPRFMDELSLNDRLLIGNQRYKINDYTTDLVTGETKFSLFTDIYEYSLLDFPMDPFYNRQFQPSSAYITSWTDTNEDGSYYVYGGYSTYSTTTSNFLTKIKRDGNIDKTFNVGTSLNSPPYLFSSIARTSADNLIVTGYFTTYKGSTASRIVKLYPSGEVNTTFVGSFNNGVNGTKLDRTNNILYAVGQFTSYNGNTSASRIVKLDSNTGNIIAMTSSTFNNNPLSITYNSDASMYVSGYFTTYGADNRKHIVKIESDGSIDDSFDPLTSFTTVPYPVTPNGLIGVLNSPDDSVYAYGYFSHYQGITQSGIIKISPNGVKDPNFNSLGFTGGGLPLLGSWTDNGKIMLSGSFSQYGSIPTYKCVVLNTDGTPHQTFSGTYSNQFNVADRIYGLDNNQYLHYYGETDERFFLDVDQIIFNAGVTYYGANIETKSSWTITKIDLGFGTDWLNVLTPSGLGSSELVFKSKDKTNQVSPAYEQTRIMTLQVSVGTISKYITIKQTGL